MCMCVGGQAETSWCCLDTDLVIDSGSSVLVIGSLINHISRLLCTSQHT